MVRAAPTASDIAQFAGIRSRSRGRVQYVETRYGNLQPLTVSGVDFSLGWRLPASAWGSFAFLVNVSQLKEYEQQKSLEEQAIAAAISSGQLDIVAQGLGAANEVGLNGQKPEWRGSAALIWSYADWTVRLRDNYIGSVMFRRVRRR